MSEQLFSASWYRVAQLRPRIKAQAQTRRQDYRGQVWYVVFDPVTGKSHRISTTAYQFLGLLDGRTTVDDAWNRAAELLGDDLPTQDEIINLLATLHRADVLLTDRAPDLEEMHERYTSQRRSERLKRFINPLFIRFKLFDPEPLLRVLEPLAPLLFSRLALVVWLVVVTAGLVTLGTHWEPFTEGLIDRVLSVDNLLVMLLVFPVIKAFHEMGHALAVKRWGGEVHDIGIMLLVFMPVPYVDASGSWAFRDKYHRMLVGAAGMLAEVFLAAIAIMLWSILEPGFARTLVYNAILIAGFTTLLFNANPLLRFDGYYILMDWLEIPNLGARSNRYFLYLCRHYLFGMPASDEDWGDRRERAWLVFYAVASFIYRLLLTLTIALFVAGKFFVVGVLLALWALTMSVFLPLFKLCRYLFWSMELRRFRRRALQVSGSVVAVIAALLFLVPLPFFTLAQGVVWVPEDNHLRSGIGGFVDSVHVSSGQPVTAGQLMLQLRDSELANRKTVLQHKLEGYQHNLRALRAEDELEAQVVRDEMEAVRKELVDVEDKLRKLTVKAPVDGVAVIAGEEDLPGRYVAKGQLIGYVMDAGETTVRVAVEQHNVGLVRGRLEEVLARFADDIFREYGASVIREVPGATDQLPSLALSAQGGGQLASTPDNQGGATSYERIFLFDLDIPARPDLMWAGERVHVRFDHGYAPLWQQSYRQLRQLFLRLSNF